MYCGQIAHQKFIDPRYIGTYLPRTTNQFRSDCCIPLHKGWKCLPVSQGFIPAVCHPRALHYHHVVYIANWGIGILCDQPQVSISGDGNVHQLHVPIMHLFQRQVEEYPVYFHVNYQPTQVLLLE